MMFKLFKKKKKCEEHLPEGATGAVPGDLVGVDTWPPKDVAGVYLGAAVKDCLRVCLRGDTVGDPKRDLYAVIHGKGMSKREFRQMKKDYKERGDIE